MVKRRCECLICNDGVVRSYAGVYIHIKTKHPDKEIKMGVTHQNANEPPAPSTMNTGGSGKCLTCGKICPIKAMSTHQQSQHGKKAKLGKTYVKTNELVTAKKYKSRKIPLLPAGFFEIPAKIRIDTLTGNYIVVIAQSE